MGGDMTEDDVRFWLMFIAMVFVVALAVGVVL